MIFSGLNVLIEVLEKSWYICALKEFFFYFCALISDAVTKLVKIIITKDIYNDKIHGYNL